ncbi:hypothetical protein GCM10007977_029760 [Dactylosporangium sucinum]|uniref:Uncharacterized protein n=1 Tax=Dactylosporangium sucinum TaxID=1424081 RepID=A0A917TKF0_9ACTN|nr:hypothetical protein GCM10007977_029760 [Dactylosporangium sucinum]
MNVRVSPLDLPAERCDAPRTGGRREQWTPVLAAIVRCPMFLIFPGSLAASADRAFRPSALRLSSPSEVCDSAEAAGVCRLDPVSGGKGVRDGGNARTHRRWADSAGLGARR